MALDESELVDLLAQQCELCRRLSGLAERQRGLITGDQAENLLGVLGERQHILEALSGIAERLRPFQRNWKGVRGGMPAALGDRVDILVEEVQRRLQAVLSSDEADARLLAARKSVAAQEMKTLRTARQAGTAYADAEARPAQVDWTDR